jgi:hypothetical protein
MSSLRAASALALVAAAIAAGCSDRPADDPVASTPRAEAGVPAGPPLWLGATGERLAALPPASAARTDQFATSDACAQCHLAGTETALRDAKGRDVSPVGTWRATPMALAARDPFYLATVSDERQYRPNLTDVVDAVCTRCHAPEAAVALDPSATTPTLPMLTTEVSPNGNLAREGVACTLCHQILPDGLGTKASFTGGFTVGTGRTIFGPYTDPTTDPMRTIVNYTPTFGDQIQKSALCGTCHTVITRPRDARGYVGPEFAEQAPYLEWLASSYANEGHVGPKAAACQDCHMPSSDFDGAELSTAIATYPKNLAPRQPFYRHGFTGGNVLLSKLAASDPAWIGATVTAEQHGAQADASAAMLKKAATLAISDVKRSGDGVTIAVQVTNGTGHKFPTGYPSRRAWLHVRVSTPDGDVSFESGRTDAYGRLVGRGDVLLEPASFAPHLDVVEREDQVQIYESVPADVTGKVTRRALDSHHYLKDNRLLPDGFDPRNAWAAFTASIGTSADANFGSSDIVTYRVARAAPGATIAVELLYQTARPSDLEALAAQPTPAARKLFDMATAAPPLPSLVAEATATAP